MNFIRKIQLMLNRVLKQIFVTVSNFISLEAARVENNTLKIALYGAENLTRFLAFSDLGEQEAKGFNYKSSSVIGALGLTTAVALDDIAINLKLYKDHHLGKCISALYIGYMLADNNQISALVPINANIIKTSVISAALLGGSYLFGSGDMIDIMRNTRDCVKFAEKVYELSDGEVDIYTDMRVAAGFGGFIGGGRQFLNDFKLDIGGPLNGSISAIVNTAAHIVVSGSSEKELKNNLLEKFQNQLNKLPSDTINTLDPRSQKILEELPQYIEKASSSITHNATNNGISTAYQQILAASKYDQKPKLHEEYKEIKSSDVGLSVFVASNLFNRTSADNLEAKVVKNLKSAEVGYNFNHEAHEHNILAMQSKLEALKNKESESVLKKMINCVQQVFDVVAPIAINSMLLGMMHNNKVSWNDSNTHKNFYMPISAICCIGKTPVDVEAFAALQELEYLRDALNNAQIPEATIYT